MPVYMPPRIKSDFFKGNDDLSWQADNWLWDWTVGLDFSYGHTHLSFLWEILCGNACLWGDYCEIWIVFFVCLFLAHFSWTVMPLFSYSLKHCCITPMPAKAREMQAGSLPSSSIQNSWPKLSKWFLYCRTQKTWLSVLVEYYIR